MGTRLQDLKLQLKMESGSVRMIGIWGIGGGGKTTLASSLYMEIRGKFDSYCFLGNIKDESRKLGMETLQAKILSTVFDKKVEVESVDIGKHTIKGMLCRRKVLIVLDDVDDRTQLEALAGSHDWFGDGSRIIITTRDKHLLITHRVDHVSHAILLSRDEAIRLFNRCAYNEDNRVEDYEKLSLRVVSYAGGLPLALIVLGSFLYDKDRNEWNSTLARLKDIPEMEILEKLKISYDGLKPLEKELFLDIACFLRRKRKYEAMEILEACGFHPGIGVKVLIQKALITISSGEVASYRHDVFDMHDLVQEMGHYIVRGEHLNNPEKHSRIWRSKEIEDICSGNVTMENDKTEAIICYCCPASFGKLVSSAKKLRLLYVYDHGERDIEGPDFLSNELRYMFWKRYPASMFPESFQPRKLAVLKLRNSFQETLWKGYKSLPCLKELHLSYMLNLVTSPNFDGLPCLEKLTIEYCDKLKDIHPSLGNHTSLVSIYVKQCKKLRKFPTIIRMGKLEILEISYCNLLHKFPEIEANMDGLVDLSLKYVAIKVLPSAVGKYCTKLRSLKLENCSGLKSIEGNFHALTHLQQCKISGYMQTVKLPKDLFHESCHLEELHSNLTMQPYIPCLSRLLRLTLSDCGLKNGAIPSDIGELSNLQELYLSWNGFSRLNFSLLRLTRLKLLNLEGCSNLVELPELPSSIVILNADYCRSLTFVGDTLTNCKWLCQVSLRRVRNVINGNRLLRSMLQGNAIENRCMSLQLKGLDIPMGFIPPLLLRWRRSYALQLPENWYSHFSGFLMCATVRKNYTNVQYITMKYDKGNLTSMDSQSGLWRESYDDVETWVGYVSFGSLRGTTWWDPTSTNIEFSINCIDQNKYESWTGFGVCLVSKRSESGQLEATTNSSEFSDDYTCNFSILYDSKSRLDCRFKSV